MGIPKIIRAKLVEWYLIYWKKYKNRNKKSLTVRDFRYYSNCKRRRRPNRKK